MTPTPLRTGHQPGALLTDKWQGHARQQNSVGYNGYMPNCWQDEVIKPKDSNLPKTSEARAVMRNQQ